MGEKAGWKEATAKGNGEKRSRIWPSVVPSRHECRCFMWCSQNPGQGTLKGLLSHLVPDMGNLFLGKGLQV